MAAIARRSNMCPVSGVVELAAADDLNGVSDNSKSFDITGAQRVIVLQENDGTAGTAGIDVIEISHDEVTWASASKVLAIDSNDATGTELNGILNAAGVEPTRYAAFKLGPYEGPTFIRCTRDVGVNAASAAWVTGAPSVEMFAIGLTTGEPAVQ